MIKTLGWLFVSLMAFSVVGFFIDWVDIKKNKDDQRIEIMFNTGKMADSIAQGIDNIVDLFNGDVDGQSN